MFAMFNSLTELVLKKMYDVNAKQHLHPIKKYSLSEKLKTQIILGKHFISNSIHWKALRPKLLFKKTNNIIHLERDQ